jgi:hypothetical protein
MADGMETAPPFRGRRDVGSDPRCPIRRTRLTGCSSGRGAWSPVPVAAAPARSTPRMGAHHAHVKLLEEHDHPSIRDLVTSGYQVITF